MSADVGIVLGFFGVAEIRRVHMSDISGPINQNSSGIFVNSDGNVTFNEGDTAISARDIGRFLDGPPRLAPFFADLNPHIRADGEIEVSGVDTETDTKPRTLCDDQVPIDFGDQKIEVEVAAECRAYFPFDVLEVPAL